MPWADSDSDYSLRGGKESRPAFEARRVIVRGRVQGVGFRWWVCSAAQRCGVNGWVANRADGSVEIFAEGEPRALSIFLSEAEKGPPLSRVESVTETKCRSEGFRGFTVKGW